MEIACNLESSLDAPSYQLLSVQILPLVIELANSCSVIQKGLHEWFIRDNDYTVLILIDLLPKKFRNISTVEIISIH
jgi:hypothetical protein